MNATRLDVESVMLYPHDKSNNNSILKNFYKKLIFIANIFFISSYSISENINISIEKACKDIIDVDIKKNRLEDSEKILKNNINATTYKYLTLTWGISYHLKDIDPFNIEIDFLKKLNFKDQVFDLNVKYIQNNYSRLSKDNLINCHIDNRYIKVSIDYIESQLMKLDTDKSDFVSKNIFELGNFSLMFLYERFKYDNDKYYTSTIKASTFKKDLKFPFVASVYVIAPNNRFDYIHKIFISLDRLNINGLEMDLYLIYSSDNIGLHYLKLYKPFFIVDNSVLNGYLSFTLDFIGPNIKDLINSLDDFYYINIKDSKFLKNYENIFVELSQILKSDYFTLDIDVKAGYKKNYPDISRNNSVYDITTNNNWRYYLKGLLNAKFFIDFLSLNLCYEFNVYDNSISPKHLYSIFFNTYSKYIDTNLKYIIKKSFYSNREDFDILDVSLFLKMYDDISVIFEVINALDNSNSKSRIFVLSIKLTF